MNKFSSPLYKLDQKVLTSQHLSSNLAVCLPHCLVNVGTFSQLCLRLHDTVATCENSSHRESGKFPSAGLTTIFKFIILILQALPQYFNSRGNGTMNFTPLLSVHHCSLGANRHTRAVSDQKRQWHLPQIGMQ